MIYTCVKLTGKDSMTDPESKEWRQFMNRSMTVKRAEELFGEWITGRCREIAPNTIRNYKNALKGFFAYLDSSEHRILDEDAIYDWFDHLVELANAGKTKVGTANLIIVSVNKFLAHLSETEGLEPVRLKRIRVERRITLENVIDMEDYRRLLKACDSLTQEGERDWTREKLMIETFANTGIRASELKYITVESLENRKPIKIFNKGKIRQIAVPEPVRAKLLEFAGKSGIESGVIFHGRDHSKPLGKPTIWKHLQRLADVAGVDRSRAHCHSIRHFCAKTLEQNGVALSEIQRTLGHSSPNTTAMYYTLPTEKELQRQADQHALYFLGQAEPALD